jgi:hypothetical protein
MNNRECSGEFLSALNGHSGPMEECMCGRVYFAIYSPTEEPEQLERYKERIKQDPIKYHPRDDDYIRAYSFRNYSDYVENCPCNGYREIEDMLWVERNQIYDYFRMTHTKIALMAKDLDKWNE